MLTLGKKNSNLELWDACSLGILRESKLISCGAYNLVKRCIISRDVFFKETEMEFKKTFDGVASRNISEGEEEKEEIHVEVEHLGDERHTHGENLNEVTDEVEMTFKKNRSIQEERKERKQFWLRVLHSLSH